MESWTSHFLNNLVLIGRFIPSHHPLQSSALSFRLAKRLSVLGALGALGAPAWFYPFVWHLTLFILGAFGAFAWVSIAGTLARVILLASPTKLPRYCDADKMLQKATTKNTNFFFEEVKQKVVIYDAMSVGFCPSSIY